jgi:hypothetical protein
LFTLLPDDSNTFNQRSSTMRLEKQLTDIGGLDHGNIVSSISNTADCLLGVLSNQPRDIGFLRRRATTGRNCGKLSCEHDKLRSESIEA